MSFSCSSFFFFNDTSTTEIYTLSLHDALPISTAPGGGASRAAARPASVAAPGGTAGRDESPEHFAAHREVLRSEEHTSELQSLRHLVCRLLLEKKKKKKQITA